MTTDLLTRLRERNGYDDEERAEAADEIERLTTALAASEADTRGVNGLRLDNPEAGFWRPCSGCQESVDGCVSVTDCPYSKTFQCQPGGGCNECGGLGVIWDDIDYTDYAAHAEEFETATQRAEKAETALAAAEEREAKMREALETIRAEMQFPNQLESGFIHRRMAFSDAKARVDLAASITRAALETKDPQI